MFSQVAKSGRRARLTADQTSFEDSRYVRKSYTSALVGEVCHHVIIDSSPHSFINIHFVVSFMHESKEDDKVGNMTKWFLCMTFHYDTHEVITTCLLMQRC